MVEKESKGGRRVVGVSELRRTYRDLDDEERFSLAARLFCAGKSPSQIQKQLSERFGGDTIRREEPYRLLQLAAALGYFHYRPPLEDQLGEKLADDWDLDGAHVVQTAVLEDVATHAARVLLDLIQEGWALKREEAASRGGLVDDRDEETGTIRIGFAGGRTVLKIVRAFVELLKREDPYEVPPVLGFHTACTGIDYHDPSTDPNAFLTHLLRIRGIDTRTFAVPYQAPPILRPEVRELLEEEPEMRKAARSFKDVDILVTAGSSWRIVEIAGSGEMRAAVDPKVAPKSDEEDQNRDPKDPDPLYTIYSQLKSLMLDRDKKGYNDLIRAGTVADMLWQPLTFNGPADVDTKVKAMTLAPLKRIPEFIGRGKKVLFALGPYEGGHHKGDVLLAALGAGETGDRERSAPPLFTHLVCDHRTARATLKAVGR